VRSHVRKQVRAHSVNEQHDHPIDIAQPIPQLETVGGVGHA
jgi:hypothetical protein